MIPIATAKSLIPALSILFLYFFKYHCRDKFTDRIEHGQVQTAADDCRAPIWYYKTKLGSLLLFDQKKDFRKYRNCSIFSGI